MADIRFEEVRKRFGAVEIIRGVSMEIKSGEFVVFVGPSGCGKSTLLRLIAGLEEISDGILRIGGKIVNDIPPASRGLAMVFQSYALYPHMSAYENMAFGLRQSGADKTHIDASVREAARILHIEELLTRKPKQLSGGQRQRGAIGRAIVRKPQVFLFDEPLSNLDAALRVQMRIEIAKLHKQLATTMIYVTHDQAEAMTLADRIVVLRAGVVEQIGSPMELYHHPQNRFVAGFIGSPQMNFLPGVISAISTTGVEVTLADGGGKAEAVVEPGAAKMGDEVTFGIRPEHVKLTNDAASVRGVVDFVEQLGDEQFAYVRLAGRYLLTARVESGVKFVLGGTVGVELPAGASHIFMADSEVGLKRGGGADTIQKSVLGSV